MYNLRFSFTFFFELQMCNFAENQKAYLKLIKEFPVPIRFKKSLYEAFSWKFFRAPVNYKHEEKRIREVNATCAFTFYCVKSTDCCVAAIICTHIFPFCTDYFINCQPKICSYLDPTGYCVKMTHKFFLVSISVDNLGIVL